MNENFKNFQFKLVTSVCLYFIVRTARLHWHSSSWLWHGEKVTNKRVIIVLFSYHFFGENALPRNISSTMTIETKEAYVNKTLRAVSSNHNCLKICQINTQIYRNKYIEFGWFTYDHEWLWKRWIKMCVRLAQMKSNVLSPIINEFHQNNTELISNGRKKNKKNRLHLKVFTVKMEATHSNSV